ncbi:hypothetical protein K469DRAFT_721525 [Zopfia rhizophila CBS 207.26]|uniref:Uncharacterized protein n=1 Tax=Zopfia rhizophila CBS 207.26 TaxID=1314779 RepID=A0A6A6EGH8_9PEZI|nr:hypothetical protein K469DRAFT_721525 [Zopfia rhizophila CBS 207.26]
MSSTNNTTTVPSTQNPAKMAWKSLAKHAKAHHESVNAAYSVYYGGGVSASSSTRPSFESARSTSSVDSAKPESNMNKAWKAVKKHAKEHHESVNAAYGAYYGAGRQ